MAKVDLTKIEGYKDMSLEDKIKALEAYETEEPDLSGYVRKEVFDKTASELAAKKKELTERLTEDEQKALQAKEEWEDLQNKYEKLLHESELSKYKAKYLGMGYDEKLAEDTAEAMVSGDVEKVFENQKKHLDSFGKKIRAEALKDTPTPVGDGGTTTMTLDQFRKLSPAERISFSEKHPNEYRALYGGNE